MATIKELIGSGQIRRGGNRPDAPIDDPREYDWVVLDEAHLARLLPILAAEYVGAVYVGWDDQVPPEVPAGNPRHCWAQSVRFGGIRDDGLMDAGAPVGAIIRWSSAEREAVWRGEQAPEAVDRETFDARRSAGIEDRG